MRRSYLRIRRNRTHDRPPYPREREGALDRTASSDGAIEREPGAPREASLRAEARTYAVRRGRG